MASQTLENNIIPVMKTYNRAKTADFYFEKVAYGSLEFSKLRKTLENEDIEKEEIDFLVPYIDRKLLRVAQVQAAHKIGKNIFYSGLVLSVIGLVITLGSLFGLFDSKGIGIIAYGPIVGGLATTFIGKSNMDRN